MTNSPPKCAVNMEQRLAALRRDQEIDGLRVYLVKYNLFPRNRDPHNSPIRIEELKELVKHWKLHRQRGFWRDHPDKDDLVRALLQHIKNEAMNKKRRQEAQEKYRNKAAAAAASALGADGTKRDFSMLFGVTEQMKEQEEKKQSILATKRFLGGDIFYQRGDYDEGMIYLSRIDKSKFMSQDRNPRDELLHVGANMPLMHLALLSPGSGVGGGASNNDDDKERHAQSSSLLHQMMALSSSSPSNTILAKEMKLRCVEGFYNVSCHRGFEPQIVREGALATIIGLLKVDDSAVRLYAAATLLNLTALVPTNAFPASSIKELYGKMLEEGMVSALLELSHTPHPSVKAFCARALFRFTSDETHHFRLVHEGAVVVLTQLMATLPSHDVKEACMKALINLASIPRAITCDAILTTLVYLVKNAKELETLQLCAVGMLNLSIMPTTRSNVVEDGAMIALSALTATKHVQLFEIITCVLCNLSAIRTNQEPMVKNGALMIVTEILDSTQMTLSVILGETLAQAEAEAEANGGRRDPAQDEALALARALARSIHKHIANTLAHLCCNPKLQARLVNAGFVPKILRLLTLDSPSIRQQQQLQQQQEEQEGGEPSSSWALDPIADEETEKLCVISVANLALDDRCRAVIVQDGAVPLLLSILHDRARQSPNATLLKLDCVTALSNLMLHPKNFRRMVDEGVVPALIALINQSDSADIQKACVYAMLNLAQDSGMKTRLAEASIDKDAGAIPTMLVFGSRQIKNAELCSVAVSFLYHLSTCRDNYEVLFYEGAVGLLVRVLHKPSSAEPPAVIYALWLDCLKTLSNLASYARKRPALVEDGVIEAIQHFLSVSGADTRRRDPQTDKRVVKAQLAASQIVFKLHELCCSTKDEIPAFFASLLLLATQSSAKNSRLPKRAVLYQQKTTLRCALTIAKVSLGTRGLRLLAHNTDIPPALNVIMRTGLHEAQVCAAIALCNMATERGAVRHRVWRDSTVEDFIVITLLRVNSDATKEICAKALFNLLTHEDTRDQMVQDGVLYALIKLSRLDNEEIRDLSLRSIYNISLQSDKAAQLLAMEIVRTLTKMYQAEYSKEMKRLMCGILSNLSAVPGGHEPQLLHEGALSILKNLVKVRDPETKVYAANVLYNLSCSTDVHDTLVRDPETNVLAKLVTLIKSDQMDVKQYAAATIANLTASSIAVRAMTDESFAVVLNDAMKRTMATCVATTASCVFALRNLFVQLVNQQKFIECNGVQTLAAILACSEMESETATLHLSTDMLCALANFDNGSSNAYGQLEERLVKDGIVRALVAIAKGTSGATSLTALTGNSSAASEKVSAMNVITSLSNLSRIRACHDLMLRDGTLEAIAFLCKTNANDTRAPFKGLVAVRGEEFCHHCAVIIRNLTVLEPDTPAATTASTTENDEGNGTNATSNANDVKGQRIAGQPATILILLALAQSSNPETREHVVMALHNLASIRRCRMQMLKNDGVKILLRLGAAPAPPAVRHVCSMALQLLSKQDSDDPHVNNIVQEGLVTAISALAEQHHQDVLLLSTRLLSAIANPMKNSSATSAVAKSSGRQSGHGASDIVLITTGNTIQAQKGAPPDWAKVHIQTMAAWKDLEDLAVATNNGDDNEKAEGTDGDSDVDVHDHDHGSVKPGSPGKGTPPTSSAVIGDKPTGVPKKTGVSSINANTITVPRTCNVDVVLGTLQLLEDTKMDKVKLSPDSEPVLRRPVGLLGADGLPKLRPTTAPEATDVHAGTGSGAPPSPESHEIKPRHSTLTQVRQEAKSPAKSPVAKRRSRMLDPLPSPSSSASLTSLH
ncbi:TPA: hypothetical protein N0F65_007622 [Lagenidium giganteum]|uniref:Vacuolar protein 8 n=1 Tax=Lagenidium giganteum TaxID=4803 RepID=A0AAV2Z692_9STRA|nr:TPA: hypothetical protein N0F65_007622 [Lagenidium giganteum]